MKRLVRPSLGLVGRIVAILLLTMVVEFGASTLLYEEANRFAVRDDEARRLAEHLVVGRRLLAERPVAARPALASGLTTAHYLVSWDRQPPDAPPISPSLDQMRRQVVAWEPTIALRDLRIDLARPGHRSAVLGGLRLPDGSWLHFRTTEMVAGPNLVRERVLLALIPAIAMVVLGGLLIRRTLYPLRRLALAANRVGRGEGEQVPEQGTREVVSVVRAFNRMQTRIHRLIADRTQALAAVAHDLRTPLARLRLRAETVGDTMTREAIEKEVIEMDAMIASMLAFLGGDEAEAPVRCDVASLCMTVVDEAADRGGMAEYRGPDHLDAEVRVSGLKRAVTNLVENALHYGESATVTLAPSAETISIAVEDSGPGIPEADIERALEPFVRLDTARTRDTPGFGLGLANARRLVEAEGGTLTLANRSEGGLAARITLPLRQ